MTELAGRILIVDDEYAIRSLIRRYFSKRGAIVHGAANGGEMSEVLQQHTIDILLLDVHLPGKDGFTLLNEVRRKHGHEIGIIILTSRNELNDRVAGLEGGADDYLPKPFEMPELLARCNAVLRRLGRITGKGEPDTSQYNFASYCLDSKTRQLRTTSQQLIELSPAEFDLLHIFVKNPHTVLNRDYLLQQTRGRDASPYDRTIDVRIGQLRKKLVSNEGSDPLFKTIRGGGYMLVVDVGKTRNPTP